MTDEAASNHSTIDSLLEAIRAAIAPSEGTFTIYSCGRTGKKRATLSLSVEAHHGESLDD